MDTQQIIREELAFLCKEYGFEYEYISSRPEQKYVFRNQYGVFQYYCCPFEESEFSVLYDQTFRVVDLKLLYGKEFAKFRKNHSGIKWWFKSSSRDYWKMIANLLRRQIANCGTLFGLRI